MPRALLPGRWNKDGRAVMDEPSEMANTIPPLIEYPVEIKPEGFDRFCDVLLDDIEIENSFFSTMIQIAIIAIYGLAIGAVIFTLI